MKYKPYRDMTEREKEYEKWVKKGRPRIVWNSAVNGTLLSVCPSSNIGSGGWRDVLFGKPHRERVVI